MIVGTPGGIGGISFWEAGPSCGDKPDVLPRYVKSWCPCPGNVLGDHIENDRPRNPGNGSPLQEAGNPDDIENTDHGGVCRRYVLKSFLGR